MSKKPIILLVGPSGSGKSTISRELHEKYGLKELRATPQESPAFPMSPATPLFLMRSLTPSKTR